MYLESEPSPTQRQTYQAHVERRYRMGANPVRDAGIDLKTRKNLVPRIKPGPPYVPVTLRKNGLWASAEPWEPSLQVESIIPRQNRFPPFILHKIKSIVAESYGKRVLDLEGQCRTPDLVLPRHIAYYLCRAISGYSYPIIARAFGGRDHTTILSGIKKISRMIAMEDNFACAIYVLRHRVETDLQNWRDGKQ